MMKARQIASVCAIRPAIVTPVLGGMVADSMIEFAACMVGKCTAEYTDKRGVGKDVKGHPGDVHAHL